MATEPRYGRYLTRESYRNATFHQFDKLENNGYDWRTNSLKKSLSTYFLRDSKRIEIIEYFQIIIAYILDYVSNIKKSINYTVDKNYKHLN